jgi:3-methyladenine DNA glycosylase AlkC
MSKVIDGVKLHDEIDEFAEELDLKNREAQGVADAAKADDGTGKKAPARKGDTGKQDPMPKLTKAGMINAMYSKLNGMKKDQLTAAYAKMHEELGLDEMDAEEVVEASYDFAPELKDLVESEATLSEEFKAKTAILFETAIRVKVAEEVDRLEDEYQTKLDEEVAQNRTDLVEKVDNYLNYVVETWMKENQLAIESGLRTEIAEGFMSNLKDLFVESYIDVPESKVDLVDELAEQVEELESKLDAKTSEVLKMTESLEMFQREAIIRESARDLADTQVEKLRSLVSSLDFEDKEAFSHKVKTVKESYFKKAVAHQQEDIQEDWSDDASAKVPSLMESYLKAIKKTNT